MDALDAISDAKRHRSIVDYRCGLDERCRRLVARLHPTAAGRMLLVAYGKVRRHLDPDDNPADNQFVIDGWGDLTDPQRREAERQRADELVLQRDLPDPKWAARSYARLVQQQSRTAAGRDRGEVLDATWLDGDGAITVTCRRHGIRTLTAARARRLHDQHSASCSRALCSSCTVIV